jgi:hypothetical protein
MADCTSLGYEDCSTQLALLFPLRAGLFSVRSGSSTSLPPPQREMAVTREESIDIRNTKGRQGRRRGSSMSELDRFQIAHLQQKSRENHHEEHDNEQDQPTLSLEMPRGSGYDTAPHSPALNRRNLLEDSVRGSIGDLMNLKQYGSMWSVRSATESIAQAVPLTTVTQRKMAVHETVTRAVSQPVCQQIPLQQPPVLECLTTSQRTERLSRLIRKQQSYKPSKVSECMLNNGILCIYSRVIMT